MIIWRPCSSCGTTDHPKHRWRKVLKGGRVTYYLSTKCVLCKKEDDSIRCFSYRSIPKNKKRIKETQRLWRGQNPDYMKKKHREYRLKNKDKISERGKSYYSRNKAKIIKRQKKARLLKRIKRWGDMTTREIRSFVNSKRAHPFRYHENKRIERRKCQNLLDLKKDKFLGIKI